ncbi:MAG TPA: hypothetical protein VK284_11080 [Streptosporangiaceae bacterium]|nr:hypothetical protein [Streptosporangiaceae bacterium]
MQHLLSAGGAIGQRASTGRTRTRRLQGNGTALAAVHDPQHDRAGRRPGRLVPGTLEYSLALEEIAGALAREKIAITDPERGDMLALTQKMKMDDPVPRARGFCPRAG